MLSITHGNVRSPSQSFYKQTVSLNLLNKDLSCGGLSESWLNDISLI